MAETNSDCPICFEPMSTTNSATTPCNHRFHTTCLLQSAMIKRACPYCRTDLINPPAQHDAPAPAPIIIEDRPVIVPPQYLRYALNHQRERSRSRRRERTRDHLSSASLAEWISQNQRRNPHQQPRAPVVRKCGVCREQGHNSRSCPVLSAQMPCISINIA